MVHTRHSQSSNLLVNATSTAEKNGLYQDDTIPERTAANRQNCDEEDSDGSGPVMTHSRGRRASTHRRFSARKMQEENDTDDSVSDEEVNAPPTYISPRRTRARTILNLQDDMSTYHLNSRDLRRMHRRQRSPKKAYSNERIRVIDTDDELDDDECGGVRRSSRQKKLKYESYNQTYIDKHLEAARAEDRYERRGIKRKTADSGKEYDDSDADTEETDDSAAELSTTDRHGSRRPYGLRVHKPRTKFYEAAPLESSSRREIYGHPMIFSNRRHHSTHGHPRSRRDLENMFARYRSQSRAVSGRQLPRGSAGGSDSTSSSGSSPGGNSSDDERRFDRRKRKSMKKARKRCLPMNMLEGDMTSLNRERTRVGASLADIDPMTIDRSVKFDSVGGLGKHIRALKEMVVFPLLYSEVFEKFSISPPRGVLFYGPPGTGKTLMARALANECSSDDRRVSFFMRKGADCLSKWVGESERQLRMLFDQAYQMRPSIIFFDEIDGLAPVRSSRQDQIHSSIVSTLLALMDGLDSRGEVVIIGATNRIDSIDPALRRPGRFDREFCFPLPSAAARQQILGIHTKDWKPRVSSEFIEQVAHKCVGYCGADLKALCTEAALHALRRRYPQIYMTNDKLKIDTKSININAHDWSLGMKQIVPAAQRATASPGRALKVHVEPLMRALMARAVLQLARVFPCSVVSDTSHSSQQLRVIAGTANMDLNVLDDLLHSDHELEENDVAISCGRPGTSGGTQYFSAKNKMAVNYRPRLLLAGNPGQGQTAHLGPALLHQLEHMPTHVLDLPALYSVTAKAPEESCAHVFREAKRTSPSIVYMPHINQWWDVVTLSMQAVFSTLLDDIEPSSAILLLATSDVPSHQLPDEVRRLFSSHAGEVLTMSNPSEKERREFYEDLIMREIVKPPPSKKQAEARLLEKLPKAPPPKPREPTKEELEKTRKHENSLLRELRLILGEILDKIMRESKFKAFVKPVDKEEVPDYYDIIKQPMDLTTMMNKVDGRAYECIEAFIADIELISSNALDYNPDTDKTGRDCRHRACLLKDTVWSLIENMVRSEFIKSCRDIHEQRKKRGDTDIRDVPNFFYCQSYAKTHPDLLPKDIKNQVQEKGDAGANAKPAAPSGREEIPVKPGEPRLFRVTKKVPVPRQTKSSSGNKNPFCRSAGKRRFRKVTVIEDEFGNEVKAEDGDTEEEDDVTPTVTINGEVSEAETHTPSPRRVAGRSPPRKARPSTGAARSPRRASQSPQRKTPNNSPKKNDKADAHPKSPTKARVTVDAGRLKSLLERTVKETAGCTVERLERLYSAYSRAIHGRRYETDKHALLKEMDEILQGFDGRK